MLRKAQLLAFTLITSAGMAMDGEQVTDTVTTPSSTDAMILITEPIIPCTDSIIPCAQHTLVSLNPAEDYHIACEELAPPSEPLTVFLSKILDAAAPGTYIDTSDQMWNVSEHEAFAAFVGNRGDYALGSDLVKPEGVYTYPETGMISVIYDFLKDGEEFFSLELTRVPEEYRIAREQENTECRAMREIQDREYQESLARDREFGAEQAELAKMSTEDALSRLSINMPPPPPLSLPSPPPLTRDQLRAHNAAIFAEKFAVKKDGIK